ncbi:MAG TPA: hypothetical protein VF131_02480 [Blastocatellia bacterium]|nr:hypothetical protein [Blastocatellia bacterium]
MTLDELEVELRKLSHADFSCLARRLGFTAPADLQWAQVEIDDDHENPIAIIEYADGSKQRIDIFAAIRHNIMTVGNPIVLIAIHHWHEILRHRPALTFKDGWDEKDERSIAVRRWLYSGRPEKASKSLSKIGKTIIDSARERSVSKEDALVALVQDDGYDQKNTLLYEAFEWLRNDKTRNEDQRLNKLEEFLRETWVSNQSISVVRVMGFLRSEKGKRCIRPRSWDAMHNAFIAWRFGISQGAVVKYFSKARKRKNDSNNEINTRFFFPKLNSYQLSELGQILVRYTAILPKEAYLKEDEADEDFGQLSAGL